MYNPPYGGAPGYPPAGGYGQPGGYPPGNVSMPTPESASTAAYGNTGGLPYPPNPGAGLGFDGLPNPGPGYPQSGGPGFPAGGPGYPPSGGPGFPAGGPGYPPSGGAGFPPSGGAGYPPSGGPGYPSSGGPGYPPSGGQGFPPSGGQGFPPSGGPGFPPSGGQGYPAGGPSYPSSGGQGFPPTGQGMPPSGQGMPPSGQGMPPSGGQGYPAGGQGYGSGGQAYPQGGPGSGGSAYPQGGPGTGGPGYQTGAPARPSEPPSGGYGAPASTSRDEGTLRPSPNFNVEEDCQRLRKAMKGMGTDEKAIIDILGYRSCDQRQNIRLMYKTCFGRDLMNDLKSELSGRFENVLIGLLYSRDEYNAYELRRAMRGAGTDEASMIEILCTRSNAEIHAMTAAYKTMYNRKLEEDIISETSGHFKKLLVSMANGGRLENQPVDQNKAMTDAQRLYQAGEKRWGTDENTFNMVLASQSYPQLRAVFEAYTRVSNHDIEKAISKEMSGDLKRGMLTVVGVVRNKAAYFADRLYHTMKGAGTDDRTLIRIVVTRCEVDMKQIKEEFMRRYGKTLESFIIGDVSGDYKKIMLALVGGTI